MNNILKPKTNGKGHRCSDKNGSSIKKLNRSSVAAINENAHNNKSIKNMTHLGMLFVAGNKRFNKFIHEGYIILGNAI